MGLFRRRPKAKTPREGHALPEDRLLSIFGSPRNLPANTDFLQLLEHYRACAIVRACVEEIVASASEPRLVVERYRAGGQWEEIDANQSGPSDAAARSLARLLRDPAGNQKTSATTFQRQILQQDQLFGNSFVYKRRAALSNRPAALELLPAPYVTPVENPIAAQVKHIYYSPEGSFGQLKIPVEDIIHRRVLDPVDSFWGLAPAVSAARELDLDKSAVDYLRTFFTNGGTPSGLLKLKGQVPPEERRRLKQLWDSMFGGGRRHSTAVLDQDAEYQVIGTRPDHLKLGDSVFDISESRACAVFGVPPVLVGIRIGIMKATYANYASARTSFWNEKLRPLYSDLDEDLTMQLAWEFGEPGQYRVRHDLTNVRDLQESSEILWARALNAYDKGLVTRNEARTIVNLPSDEGGEHYKTKTADGKSAKPEALPEANPTPKPGTAGPARPSGALSLAEGS